MCDFTCVTLCLYRQTEPYARWLLENQASKVVFNTPEESAMVNEVFNSALAGLKPAELDLRIVKQSQRQEHMNRQTEHYARWLLENQASKVVSNTPEESAMVDEVFDSTLAGLNECVIFTCVTPCLHRQTEHYARWLLENQASKVVFNTPEESAMVDEVFDSALAGLKPADRDLRIVQGIRGLLRAGIAMHHSGLLPILKEVIEILFQEGLVKVHI